MRYSAYVLAALLATAAPKFSVADNQQVDFEENMLAVASSWTNQSGSVASLSFEQSTSQPNVYVVSGIYVNNEAQYQCKGTPYPLSGIYYTNTETISFSVAWSNSSEDCQSVTGWTGYIDIDSSQVKMETKWNLAYSDVSGRQIEQGSDTFTMTSTIRNASLTKQ